MHVEVFVRVPLDEAQRLLSGPQLKALMWGIAKVITAASAGKGSGE